MRSGLNRAGPLLSRSRTVDLYHVISKVTKSEEYGSQANAVFE